MAQPSDSQAPSGDDKKSWWQTLPGLLTATATIITALTGLLVAIKPAVTTQPRSETQQVVPTASPKAVQDAAPPQNKRSPTSGSGEPPNALRSQSNVKSEDESHAKANLSDGKTEAVRLAPSSRLPNDDKQKCLNGSAVACDQYMQAIRRTCLGPFDTICMKRVQCWDARGRALLLIKNTSCNGLPAAEAQQCEAQHQQILEANSRDCDDF